MQNFITRKILNVKFIKKLLKLNEINLDENYIYIFLGYNTLHGVGPHFEGLRSTAAFHFYNPHENGIINKAIIKRHQNQRISMTKIK